MKAIKGADVMKKVFIFLEKNILLCLILTFGLLILVCSVFHVSQGAKLYGVTMEHENVDISLATLMNGEYQQYLEDEYLNKFSLRNYFVKGYNEILFQIKATNNNVVCGKEGYLFGKEEVASEACGSTALREADVYKKYAENIKIIQQYLEEQGKGFVYIISPNKAEVYKDKLPDRVRRSANVEKNNHEELKKALEEQGITTVDATSIMQELRQEGEISFYKMGNHWSEIGAMRTMQSAFSLLDGQSTLLKTIDYYIEETDSPLGADNDIYLLSNIYSPQTIEKYHFIRAISNEMTPSGKICFLGTSFCGQLTDLYQDNAVFENVVHYRYLQLGYEIKEGQTTVLEVSSKVDENHLEDVLSESDIIVFETNAAVLMQSHIEIAQYLANIIQKTMQLENIK